MEQPKSERPSIDKLSGVLTGLSTGDALGVPHEFKSQSRFVYTGILYLRPEFVFRSGKRTDVIGQYSDDCEATLCIIRSVIECRGYNKEAIVAKYMEWARDAKAMGRNTRALFKGIKTLGGFQTRWDKTFGQTDPATWTQSNGSLMRCSFLAFLDPSFIALDCALTNPHPINISSSYAYCYMIKYTALDYDKKSIIDVVLAFPLLRDEVKQVIMDAVGNAVFSRDLMAVGKGWVLHSLYSAVWGWYHFDTYQDPIDTIIRAGGDTDTNAAIAGALIGAKLGYAKLLTEERTSYNIEMVRSADYSQGENPRPAWLCLTDFYDIVESFWRVLAPLDTPFGRDAVADAPAVL
jgi:ADP-ribosylglycohydrolase